MNLKKICFLIIFIVSAVPLIKVLFDNDIFFGQIGKQTYTAEKSRSWSRDITYKGVFPMKHFVETYHLGPIPWSEEVPIYSYLTGKINRLSGIPLIITGRILSFISFLLLLWGMWQLGLYWHIQKKVVDPAIFPLIGAIFPIFRIYSVMLMPDMFMAALVLWSINFYLREKHSYSLVALTLAAMFKYFAFFAVLGFCLSILLNYKKNGFKTNFKLLTLYALTPFPAIIYLLLVIYFKIPNSISEYHMIDGTGHFTKLTLLFSADFYSRMFTWTFIKNPTIPGIILALVGIWVFVKRSDKLEKKLFLSLFLSFILFILIFASSYYIHDYYSLQLMILASICAAWALDYLINSPLKWNRYLGVILVLAVLINSVIYGYSTQRKIYYYQEAANLLKEHTNKEDKILSFCSRWAAVPLFMADRFGWVVDPRKWIHIPYFKQSTNEIINKGLANKSILMIVGGADDHKRRYTFWKDMFKTWGFEHILAEKMNQEGDKRRPKVSMVVLAKQE